MVDLLLIYPYFNDDESIFKFPPLGLGYIASYVRSKGYSVKILDCTFLSQKEALAKARAANAGVIGISIMSSMLASASFLAQGLRGHCDLLIAGGPLPTATPAEFLDAFDLVAIGEGEVTVAEILKAIDAGKPPFVYGTAHKEGGKMVRSPPREILPDLDAIPFPARDLYDHEGYKKYFKKRYGYTITSIMASRGCPFDCEFCSRPVFGNKYRGRKVEKIVDEMVEVTSYDYDRLWIADDIFPISKKAGMEVCQEKIRRGVDIAWESLCRVDVLDQKLAAMMKSAGCHRVFFGMESGNDSILSLMNKRTSVQQEKEAVSTMKSAGIKVGGFFILGYPGETNETMLDTMRLASSLPFDYLSLTLPYPIPGTRLYERVKDRMVMDDMRKEQHGIVKHVLTYQSEFSSRKLKFGIIKTMGQHYARKHLRSGYAVIKPIELISDRIFSVLR